MVDQLGDYALHPMMVAQIRSVRPESKFGPYVEWFATEQDRVARLFVSPGQDAFSFVWFPEVFSWAFPPVELAVQAAEKFTLDRSRGVIILPVSDGQRWFDDILANASMRFNVSDDVNSFRASPGPGCRLTALVIDRQYRMTSPLFVVNLAISASASSKFRAPACPFDYEFWQIALAYFPDQSFTTRILDGIRFGRSLDFTGPRLHPRVCRNPRGFSEHKDEIMSIIAKDESKNFRAGPFPDIEPPLFNLLCSPIRGVPKRFSPDKVRLVKNLSWPHDGTSVNAKSKQGVTRCITLAMICAVIVTLGAGTIIWAFDVESAYKLISVIVDDWFLQGEISDLGFAFSTVCDFGGANSGHIWHEYGIAIEFILRHHTLLDALLRYVDDFILLVRPISPGHPDWAKAGSVRQEVIELCRRLGIPIPDVKHKGPGTTVSGVLGWTIDTLRMELSITDERRRMMLAMLADWLIRGSASITELKSLGGLLSYLCDCFRWGRAFLGHTINLSHSRRHPSSIVKLGDAFRADMQWWFDVVNEWKGRSLFYDLRWTTSESIGFEVDASRLGHGACCQTAWYSRQWSSEELTRAQRKLDISMPFLEALAIAYACATFGQHWGGKLILCRSDCEPAMHAINSRYSRDSDLRLVIRSIGVLACRFGFDLRVEHVPGLLNVRADPLSRLNIPAFREQALFADSSPTAVSLPPGLT